ncbi:GNAT family N-acetyltransferase [Variovorax sp. J22R133]|uniref:GNAT family N-acetyltransferase n=1 Tax=Variovorax brevis TaxID=3053503 RepID=UPI002577E85C|nr:GNAT family N-acetyltransferase [Variovorax sp. J22R133]MDM0115992.1 GNAT family N-acetyltransferase [Variovorax sp. J22R133]
MTFQIARASTGDAEAISQLIRGLVHHFTVDPDGRGAEVFLSAITPGAIGGYVAAPNFCYFVARAQERLVGVVGVRDNTHLYHLFVDASCQGQGLSRRLWEQARTCAVEAGNHSGFTVNSSPNAIPVYERFGFRAVGERTEMNGIAFVPMRLESEASHVG